MNSLSTPIENGAAIKLLLGKELKVYLWTAENRRLHDDRAIKWIIINCRRGVIQLGFASIPDGLH